MSKVEKKEVAIKDNQQVAAFNYGTYEVTGYENTSKDDFSIPFIKILQSMSPEIKPVSKGGVEGAQVGKIMNSVTQELYDGDEGIKFVPAVTETLYIEWKPREQGGGFVATHKLDSDVIVDAIKRNNGQEFGMLKTKDGNELNKTFNMYVVLTDGENSLGYAVISATSTKIKVCRQLMAKLHSFMVEVAPGKRINPPLFANCVRLTTVEQKGAKGEFYNIAFSPANGSVKESLLPPGHAVLEEAVNFNKLINEGKAKADFAAAPSEVKSESSEDTEKAPF